MRPGLRADHTDRADARCRQAAEGDLRARHRVLAPGEGVHRDRVRSNRRLGRSRPRDGCGDDGGHGRERVSLESAVHRGKRAETAGAPFSRPSAGNSATARHDARVLSRRTFYRTHDRTQGCARALRQRIVRDAPDGSPGPSRRLRGGCRGARTGRRNAGQLRVQRVGAASRLEPAEAQHVLPGLGDELRARVVVGQDLLEDARAAPPSPATGTSARPSRHSGRPRAGRRCRRPRTGIPRPSPRARPSRTARRSTAQCTCRRPGRASATCHRRSSPGTCRAGSDPDAGPGA